MISWVVEYQWLIPPPGAKKRDPWKAVGSGGESVTVFTSRTAALLGKDAVNKAWPGTRQRLRRVALTFAGKLGAAR